ncbi:hypothetical protein Sango_2786500 [Sesamum angolense]|uniref:WD repeat and HMG-box DNA-binding protein 1 n=1 Tax=Sesamum angolense TaxID=2727404 RepID=A0AAE1W0Q6_9LAMI|nr:hypothetical protein Sango_2786500 [Sesamum angolense]
MKIRTMKLREAHKRVDEGESSVCSILWASNGDYIVTASSSDNSICIHTVGSPSNMPKFLRNHREGVTALALSPNSTCLASGSLDHSVKLYKFPGGDFETNITRFTLPIRAVAFNKSGTILAAAGDDEGIKLVNTIDGTIARVLKGHKGSVTSLAFDPKSEYLASLDSEGTVIYWELQSGSTVHVLKAIAPNNGMDVSLLNLLAWSPDGEMLAVPGLKNDVVMYDRDTAEKLFSLRGDHTQPICFLSWSPNGKYMATSGLDRQILIWDVDKKQDIDRQKFTECISCMAWKPHGNALAVIDITGKYGVWESAVPLTMKSPTEDIPGLHSKNSNGFLLFDEEEEPSASGNLSDLNEDSHGEFEPPSKKDYASYGHKDNLNGKSGSRHMTVTAGPKMQEAFQPGATPAQHGKRHFLCYNMLGSITTMEHDGYSHIEISMIPAVVHVFPAMTDYFGFTMASLNENGSVFANPCKGEKNMSTLMYRPFSSWANNSEWSMRFEGEEVRAIALGSAWVAAVTSLNFLRIFTEGGLQRYVLSLDGPVVTAAGYKMNWQLSPLFPSLPTDEQMLEFRVFNIAHGTQPLRGRLPLTPGSCLTWLGFSEEGHLSSFDSKVQRSIEERAASGHDTASLDDEAFNLETSLDRCILRLIASCCNVRGAIKLVTALKLPNLAERFSSILEEKLLSETSGNAVLPDRKFNCNGSIQHDAASVKLFTAPEISQKSEGIVPSPTHTLPSTSSASKRNGEEPCKDRHGNSIQGQTTTLGKATDLKTAVKLKADDVQSLGETKTVKVDQLHFSRPSNPFAKSASNQESSSLFDSLKKMKK